MRAAAEKTRAIEGGVEWLEAPDGLPHEDLEEAVRKGLGGRTKSLPSRFFYDAEGSRLFEQICELPEYYLTRAETEILESASADLARRLPDIETVIELGSGSATKTELLLRAFEADRSLRYAPIDVSRSALEASVERLVARHPELEILATIAEYESGLAAIDAVDVGPKLLLWLGSSIGNLRSSAAGAFLARRREGMSHADRFLVGIDLRKDRIILERAYDDAEGVTAQFDLNLLTRINHAFRGHFDIGRFAHRVHYDEESGSVQSFLESQVEQSVELEDLDLEVSFEAGERIHTEDSFKYSIEEIDALAAKAGLETEHCYLDAQERFSLNLFRRRT
jgi:L-histidine N-alpha-methyltransferase